MPATTHPECADAHKPGRRRTSHETTTVVRRCTGCWVQATAGYRCTCGNEAVAAAHQLPGHSRCRAKPLTTFNLTQYRARLNDRTLIPLLGIPAFLDSLFGYPAVAAWRARTKVERGHCATGLPQPDLWSPTGLKPLYWYAGTLFKWTMQTGRFDPVRLQMQKPLRPGHVSASVAVPAAQMVRPSRRPRRNTAFPSQPGGLR